MVGLFGMVTIGCSKAPNVPTWWNTTDTRGYITGRGVEKPNSMDNLNDQNDFAMANARSDLSGKMETKIISLLTKKGDGGKTEATKSTLLKSAIKGLVQRSKLLKSAYTDDGRLWIKLGVKISDVEKIIDEN